MGAGGWIADLFGYKDVLDALGDFMPRRSALRFIGAGLADNATLGTTDIFAAAVTVEREFAVNPSLPASDTIFATIQDAINAVPVGLGPGFQYIINLPSITLTENLVIPDNIWVVFRSSAGATIAGTVTHSGSGSVQKGITLERVSISGTVTLGSAIAFSQLLFRDCGCTSGINAADWDVHLHTLRMPYPVSGGVQSASKFDGAIVATTIDANGVALAGDLTAATIDLVDSYCSKLTAQAISASSQFSALRTISKSALSITSPAALVDEFSYQNFTKNGLAFSGSYSLTDSAFSTGLVPFSNNVAGTHIVNQILPKGLYLVSAYMQRSINGTSGTAQVNMQCADELGAFNLPISGCSFDIVSGPTRVFGQLLFRADGISANTFTISGITTPGALAAQYEIKLRKI